MEATKALIVLDSKVVASAKYDQAVWLLNKADAELKSIADRYSLLTVGSDDEKVEAEQGIIAIRKLRKEWDAARKEWGQPLDATKKAMDGAMRQRDDPAKGIEDGLILQVAAYMQVMERARLAREAEARKAADDANRILREKAEAERKAAEQAGKVYVEQGIPEVVVKTEEVKPIAKAEGIHYVRRWEYRVDDLTKVPDAYTKRVIDDEKVTQAIRAATTKKGDAPSECTASIPGIIIYHEDRPGLR
jgi:hypothetical protein